MSGDWIKMRVDLREDPAVFRLAKLTKLDRLSVVGRLWAFWSWADKHAVGGSIAGADAADVDEIVDKNGFAEALREVGWLELGDGCIAIPKHDRHTGDCAKERSLKNARQARWRQSRGGDVDGDASTDASTDGRVDGRVDGDASTRPSTREEKRREEKEKEKDPLASLPPPQKPSVKGSRLPADWQAGPDGMAFAEQHGLRGSRGSTEAEKFRDYWSAQPGQRGVKVDWQATWRNWVRKAAEAPPQAMTFKERDAANAAARTHRMTGGLMGKPHPFFQPCPTFNVIEMETKNAPRIAGN
jgi:hypothetical protein